MTFYASGANADYCDSDVRREYTEYFETEYVGLCMDDQHYLGNCAFPWFPCNSSFHGSGVHPDRRYNDSSVSWVLTAAILVFFMKAGFMLLELAFTEEPRERRLVILYKYVDAFGSAFGFFFIGFDVISGYNSPQCVEHSFFSITDPTLWFFKFTFASNSATILGGCLLTNRYKLRIPAAFLSAFVISGIIHPTVAWFIWSDDCNSFSPYRFCVHAHCDSMVCSSFHKKAYFLDFAGGGAVHLLGGTAGLLICIFAKVANYLETRSKRQIPTIINPAADSDDDEQPYDIINENEAINDDGDANIGNIQTKCNLKCCLGSPFKWMYPETGANVDVDKAALGVLILWFAWFAFNCGSTESVES